MFSKEDFETFLPKSHEFEIEEFETITIAGSVEPGCKVTLRLKCKSKEEMIQWRSAFQEETKVTWISDKSFPNAPTFAYREDFLCQHSRKNKVNKAGSDLETKNNLCEARMSLKIKLNTPGTRKYSYDKFVKRGFVSVVVIKWCHNHQLRSAVALSYRSLSDDVKTELKCYFEAGMKPRDALAYYKSKLTLSNGFREAIRSDAALWPKMKAVYRLYEKWGKESKGSAIFHESAVENQNAEMDSQTEIVPAKNQYGPNCDTHLHTVDHRVHEAINDQRTVENRFGNESIEETEGEFMDHEPDEAASDVSALEIHEYDDAARTLLDQMSALVQTYRGNREVQNGLRIFTARMKLTTSACDFASLLCSVRSLPNRPKARISRQPRSGSLKTAGTCGSKRRKIIQ